MPIENIRKELIKIGQLMNYWQAELWAIVWGAAVAVVLWMASLSDYFLHITSTARISFWGVLVVVCIAGIWRIWMALATRRSLEGIAARVEFVFPSLDNRLINVVQFSGSPSNDPMLKTYVRQGVPNWNDVQVKRLKDREKHKRACIAFGIAAVLLGAPFLWMSESWTNALARIVNPFSSRPASTLAQVESVTPGDTNVTMGNAVTITVKAQGKAGQPVTIDLWPSDDKASSVKIGQLAGKGIEDFSFRLPKVAANVDYRAHAGDSTSARFHITAQSALGLTRFDVTVTPRKETGMPVRRLNGLTDQIIVPQGSDLTLTIAGNRTLLRGYASMGSAAPVTFSPTENGKALTGTVRIVADGAVAITGYAAADEKFNTALKVQLEPDHPPVVRIVTPKGRTTLATGAFPSIQWEATDDFGVTRVAVEQVTVDNGKSGQNAKGGEPDQSAAPGTMLQEWKVNNERKVANTWTGGESTRPAQGQSIAFRVVAYDNFNLGQGEPHRSQSGLVIFQSASLKDMVDAAAQAANDTEAALAKLVEAQSKNLARTRELGASKTAKPEQWTEVQDRQKEIRKVTGAMLADPKKPLVALQDKVMPIYQEQMLQVIGVLGGIPAADDTNKGALTERAIGMEDWILRVLSGVESALPQAQKDKRITDMLSMMDALVRGQKEIVTATKVAVEKSITTNAPLVKKQDRLAGDTDQFADAAKAEAANMKGSDATFSDMLLQVSGELKTRNVSADMLKASEQLDSKEPAKATPFEETALKNLEELYAMLNAWRVDTAQKRAAELVAQMQKASDTMTKLVNMQKRVVESMRALKPSEDKTTGKDTDAKANEIKAKQDNIAEAALKVATDLHIFPEANVGNEVAKQLVTKYEKVEQTKDSEHTAMQESGLQKEDFELKDLEKAAERIKDGLAELNKAPDNFNRLTENFDQKEFPGKIAMVPLADKVEDLIGDLLKQDSDIADKIKNSATNQASKDFSASAGIGEGEIANYSAKGKSGNAAPKHNEQSGRSNIGRQGMANGEAAAGTGKINKGDDKIEKRMTQDSAQSGEMGHIDDSEAKAVATGGGKLSGSADAMGMAGNGPRRDSKSTQGSEAGMQALLRKNADSIYAQATLQHVRTGSLDDAIRHMRDAEEAMREGRPIEEVREFQRQSRESLRKTQVELTSGVSTEAIDSNQQGANKPAPDQKMAGTVDEAPENYQGMVSDYYKAISSAPH